MGKGEWEIPGGMRATLKPEKDKDRDMGRAAWDGVIT